MASTSASLEHRSLIRVEGDEAAPFLQSLLTCNIGLVSETDAVFGALLTPQGKILFDLFVVRHADGFLIEISSAQREAFIKRLQFYKLRAKVTIDVVDELKVFAIWGASFLQGFADPRFSALGRRHYAADFVVNGTAQEYAAHRVFCAVPEAGEDYPLGDTFPHEANYDLLHGVDFSKGCYVGQEVVSRMQHKTEIKKRIIPFTITGDNENKTAITANGTAIGTLGSHNMGRALALTRLGRLRDALDAGASLQCGNALLTPQQPPWGALPYGVL